MEKTISLIFMKKCNRSVTPSGTDQNWLCLFGFWKSWNEPEVPHPGRSLETSGSQRVFDTAFKSSVFMNPFKETDQFDLEKKRRDYKEGCPV